LQHVEELIDVFIAHEKLTSECTHSVELALRNSILYSQQNERQLHGVVQHDQAPVHNVRQVENEILRLQTDFVETERNNHQTRADISNNVMMAIHQTMILVAIHVLHNINDVLQSIRVDGQRYDDKLFVAKIAIVYELDQFVETEQLNEMSNVMIII
jgi:hypothetical protein